MYADMDLRLVTGVYTFPIDCATKRAVVIPNFKFREELQVPGFGAKTTYLYGNNFY